MEVVDAAGAFVLEENPLAALVLHLASVPVGVVPVGVDGSDITDARAGIVDRQRSDVRQPRRGRQPNGNRPRTTLN